MVHVQKILLFLQDKLIYLIGLICTALSPISHLLLLMFIFVFFDFVTGILKAIHKGEKIISKKLRHTATKLLTYASLIIVLYLFDLHFAQPLWDVTIFFKVAMFIIGSIEVISINENVTEILGINVLSKVKDVINKFNSKQS